MIFLYNDKHRVARYSNFLRIIGTNNYYNMMVVKTTTTEVKFYQGI